MDKAKRAKLEAAGWVVATPEEFLNLSMDGKGTRSFRYLIPFCVQKINLPQSAQRPLRGYTKKKRSSIQ